MASIPLFGVPILNRGDLLIRLFLSIDYPVDQFVIVNNGTNPSVERAITRILKKHSNVEVLTPGGNIGVAASWNLIMERFPSPFYFICSNDIQFTKGDMGKMVQEAQKGDTALLLGNQGMAFFILGGAELPLVGTFDENFYPAYYEDVDWRHRARMVSEERLVVGVSAIHGEEPHWCSSTIHSNKHYLQKHELTYNQNATYYERKWGGKPDEETFDHPFGDPDWPITKWVLEEDRLEQMKIW